MTGLTSAELLDAASALWAEGKTLRQIAIRLRVSPERVKSAMKRHRDRFPYRDGRRAR